MPRDHRIVLSKKEKHYIVRQARKVNVPVDDYVRLCLFGTEIEDVSKHNAAMEQIIDNINNNHPELNRKV